MSPHYRRMLTLTWVLAAVALAALGVATSALADEPLAPSVSAVASSWSFDPTIIIPLVVFVWFYQRGVNQLWTRFGRGRVISRQQVGLFSLGIVLIALTLLSPLDGLSATLFSAHMVEHMMLTYPIPPLLLLGRIDLALPAALPKSVRHPLQHREFRRLAHFIMHPTTVWVGFALVYWIWHMPGPYQATLSNDWIHASEHISMLLVSLAFWELIMRHAGRRSFPYYMAIAFVFTTMIQMTVLGVVLTFTSTPWYPAYGPSTRAWGFNLLEDQQIGALIMWMTSNTVYLGMETLLFAHWFSSEERHADRRAITMRDWP